MNLELLYFEDCPNWKVAADRLHAVATSRGLDVAHHIVTSVEEAEALRFRGSPTVLVDGRDPFASGGELFGLACRIYQSSALGGRSTAFCVASNAETIVSLVKRQRLPATDGRATRSVHPA
jgi:hypothetical protein